MNNNCVYILSYCYNYEYHLIDVFSTQEKAEKAMSKHLELYYDEILDSDIPEDNIIRYFTMYGTYIINRITIK